MCTGSKAARHHTQLGLLTSVRVSTMRLTASHCRFPQHQIGNERRGLGRAMALLHDRVGVDEPTEGQGDNIHTLDVRFAEP